MNRGRGRETIFYDPDNYDDFRQILAEAHQLFWIPMQYWAAVAVALGVFVAFIDRAA